jgi:DNA-binding transcriptional LysR family regulator
MKRLDLNQLASFVALVDAGSFGRAARSLGLSQSAVSQQLMRLEKQLDVRLIDRAPGRSVPTTAAERLLPLARSLLRLERRAHETAQRAQLSLGACSNLGIYLVPSILRDFCTAGHPAPTFVVGDNPAIVTRLEAAEIDVALLEWWDDRPGFTCEPWVAEPVVAIAPLGHPWTAVDAVAIEELASSPLVGGEAGTGTGRLLRNHLDPGRVLPKPAFELGSTEAVKRAVAAGLGVSVVLALSVVREIRDQELVVRPLAPAIAKQLMLVRRDDVGSAHPLIACLRAAAARRL